MTRDLDPLGIDSFGLKKLCIYRISFHFCAYNILVDSPAVPMRYNYVFTNHGVTHKGIHGSS